LTERLLVRHSRLETALAATHLTEDSVLARASLHSSQHRIDMIWRNLVHRHAAEDGKKIVTEDLPNPVALTGSRLMTGRQVRFDQILDLLAFRSSFDGGKVDSCQKGLDLVAGDVLSMGLNDLAGTRALLLVLAGDALPGACRAAT